MSARSYVLRIPVTPGELEAMERLALAAVLPVAVWVRDQLLGDQVEVTRRGRPPRVPADPLPPGDWRGGDPSGDLP